MLACKRPGGQGLLESALSNVSECQVQRANYKVIDTQHPLLAATSKWKGNIPNTQVKHTQTQQFSECLLG